MTDVASPHEADESFRASFAAVVPLIREEWAEVDADALEATEGDLGKAVALVAKATHRTRVAVRRQIEELLVVAQRNAAQRGGANGAATAGPEPGEKKGTLDVEGLVAAVRRLERFASDEAKRVGKDVVPGAEAKIKQNVWVSLLLALGLGMILGLWMNGRRRS